MPDSQSQTVPPLIRAEALDKLIAQAERESWTHLALIPERCVVNWQKFREHWLGKRVFRLDAPIGAAGAQAIAQHLPQLTSLNIEGNEIGEAGAQAIAQHLSQLTSLNIGGNEIGEAGAQAIAQHLSQLTSLNIWHNEIGEAGAQAIAQHLPQLTSLNIWHNEIGEAGAQAIAQHLPQLTSLDIGGNEIGEAGAQAIAQHLPQLTSLDIGHNEIGEAGAQAIAQHLSQLTSLDIGFNQIGAAGAQAIAQHLPQLTSLNIEGNEIGEAGAQAIAQHLSQLTSLDIGGNEIGAAGAQAIAQHLSQLTSLDIGGNEIGAAGAQAIAQHLSQLTSLDIGGNEIGEAGAQAIAQHLSQLTSLNIWFNQIGAAGAQAIAQHLPQLTSLDIGSNEIGAAGAQAILEALADRADAHAVTRLDLRRNGDLTRVLPSEALQTRDAQAILAAYRRFRDASEQEKRPFNEAKLLVVGKEAVGKTSLVRYLIHGTPRVTEHHATIGIDAHERIETEEWTPEDCPITLNIWDFAGQEMRYGTHRYFLSERCLYLVVLNDRERDDASVHTWLKTIASKGGDSPVLIVINQSDDPKRPHLQLDETLLQERYPGIAGFLRTSVPLAGQERDWHRTCRTALREKIAEVVSGDARLDMVRRPVLRPWLAVRNEVGDLAREQSVLRTVDFERICDRHSITEESERDVLLLTLHELGVVVAYGLDRNDIVLSQITLLDPNWLTGAFYELLAHQTVREQHGILHRHQLEDLLDRERYPAKWDSFILEMMQDHEVGLAFALPGQNRDDYLIPQALPTDQPRLEGWSAEALRFRYRYDMIPPGLIPRFIGQANVYRSRDDRPWATGVVLRIDDCRLLVRGERHDGRIEIFIDGPAAGQKREALSRVLHLLETVHRLYPESKPEPCVPLLDQPELDESYHHLKKLEAEEGLDHTYWPPKADRKYSVRELLEGPGRDVLRRVSVDRDDRPSPRPAPRASGTAAAEPEPAALKWWQQPWVGLVATAIVAMLILVPVFAAPESRWAWLPVAGVAVAVIANWYRRANRYFRVGWSVMAVGAAAALVPAISATVDIPSLGEGSIIIDASPWLAVGCIAVGLICLILDFLDNRRK
jgi:small GTP-binding protein